VVAANAEEGKAALEAGQHAAKLFGIAGARGKLIDRLRAGVSPMLSRAIHTSIATVTPVIA